MREITIKHKAKNTKKKVFLDDETNVVLDEKGNEVDMRFWTYDPSPNINAVLVILALIVIFLLLV